MVGNLPVAGPRRPLAVGPVAPELVDGVLPRQPRVGEAHGEERVLAERVLEGRLDARVAAPAPQRAGQDAAVRAQLGRAERALRADVRATYARLGHPDRHAAGALARVERAPQLGHGVAVVAIALGVLVLRPDRGLAGVGVGQRAHELPDAG